MSSSVHGWRYYSIFRCSRTDELVLRGSYGMHVHTNPSPHAECRGLAYGMWMTPPAQDQQKLPSAERERHESMEAPVFECSCGFYIFRTLSALTADHPTEWGAVAHVTAIEKAILHQEGCRAQMYAIDYLLKPPDMEREMPVFSMKGPVLGSFPLPVETVKLRDAFEEIAGRLDVPLLSREDLAGCPDCLLANSWRKPDEVTEEMRRVWYGR